MKRQLLALVCGTASGYLIGKALGINAYPFLPLAHSHLWLMRVLALFAIGVLAGAITSLISWRHTPGLPGMSFSLAIAMLGLASRPSAGSDVRELATEVWVSYTMEALLILFSMLLTYMLAWAVDTKIVFRKLVVKPAAKQINSRLMLTQLLPCCLLTAIGGVIALLLPITVLITLVPSFALVSFLASSLFKSRSTLWYSASAPLYIALAGFLVLSIPSLFNIITPPNIDLNRSFIFCGLGSAGAIFGHWLWVAFSKRPITS
ncbi:MAG: hypothetical protein AB1489_15495 [Acidobacteriota bacterium]